MAKLVKVNGFEIKTSKKDIEQKVEDMKKMYLMQWGDIFSNLPSVLNELVATDGANGYIFRKAFNCVYRDGYFLCRSRFIEKMKLNKRATITEMVQALQVICDKLLCFNDVETSGKILDGYKSNWYLETTEQVQTDEKDENWIITNEDGKTYNVKKIKKKHITEQYVFSSKCKKISTFLKQIKNRYSDLYNRYLNNEKWIVKRFLEHNGNCEIGGYGFNLRIWYDFTSETHRFRLVEKRWERDV